MSKKARWLLAALAALLLLGGAGALLALGLVALPGHPTRRGVEALAVRLQEACGQRELQRVASELVALDHREPVFGTVGLPATAPLVGEVPCEVKVVDLDAEGHSGLALLVTYQNPDREKYAHAAFFGRGASGLDLLQVFAGKVLKVRSDLGDPRDRPELRQRRRRAPLLD